MIPKKKKVAIVGAGIAGLSAAYNLKKQEGIEVKLFERANRLPDTGLGFLIMSNGMETFERMGIEKELSAAGNEINNYLSVNKNSEALEESALDNCLAISRSKCIQAVYDLLDKDIVVFGKEIINFTEEPGTDQKTLHFKDGTSYTADILIGADGLRSNLRSILFPNHEITIVKEKEIVGVAKHPELVKKFPNTLYKVVNPDKGVNMGLLPSLDGEIIWYIQFNEDKINKPENTPDSLKSFCNEIALDLPVEFQEVIEFSDFDRTYLWAMADVKILPSFHKNNILLIGDAAHPVLAFTSQGVNSALEDSYLIADLLKDNPTAKSIDIFKKFDEIRRPVIEKTLNGGRLLLDQFLHHEKYSNIYLPFVDHKLSFSK